MNVVTTVKDVRAKLTGKHAQDPAPEGKPAPSRLVPPNPAFLPGDETSDGEGGGYTSSSTDGNAVSSSPVTPPPFQQHPFGSFGGGGAGAGAGQGKKGGGILQNARRSLSGEEARGKAVERGPSFERKPSTGSSESRSVSAPLSATVSQDPDQPNESGRRSVSPSTGRGGQREGSCLKFAPLPDSGRSKRNSISLGVAARANLITGQGDAMEGLFTVPSTKEDEEEKKRVKEREEVWYDDQAAQPLQSRGSESSTIQDATRGVRKLFRRISSSRTSPTAPPQPAIYDAPPAGEKDRPLPEFKRSLSPSSRARAATVDASTSSKDSASPSPARGRTRWAGIGTRDIRAASEAKADAHEGNGEQGEVQEEVVEDASLPSASPSSPSEAVEEGDLEGEEDKEEEEAVRSRSTTRAGGVEKVHKHSQHA